MPFEGCKNQKITFVLGAGASIPFIRNGDACLSTHYLTEQITNRERWTAIYNKFKESIPHKRFPEQNFNISLDDIFSIIERLKSINELEVDASTREKSGGLLPQKFDDLYGIGKMNFEYILYLLDKVSNYLYDRKSSVDNILFDIWGEHAKEKESLRWLKKGWNYVPFLCREVLVNAVLDLWESCPRREALEVYKRFFASILEDFERVSIYSLNYDPLLYESVKEVGVKVRKKVGYEINKCIKSGFSGDNGFNPKELYYEDNIIALLHGHVGFVPEGGGDSVYFEDDYAEAQRKRIEGVGCGRVGYFRKGIKGIHYNVSITSGMDKFESFYDNPYACYIQRFSEDVIKSEYIVIIGAGLGDYHVNLFISNAWRLSHGYADYPENVLSLRKSEIVPKKIIIVTKDEPRNDRFDYFVYTPWGEEFFRLIKEGISGFDPDSVSASLRKKGYAWVNRYLFLYRLGADRFFSEIGEIPDLFQP